MKAFVKKTTAKKTRYLKMKCFIIFIIENYAKKIVYNLLALIQKEKNLLKLKIVSFVLCFNFIQNNF